MKLRRIGAVLAAASLTVAACGGDEEESGAGTAEAESTAEATAEPTAEATAEATAEPTAEATAEPTAESTAEATGDGGATTPAGGLIQAPGQCGLGTGEPADESMEPIKLGGLATNIPGIDFTWIPKMAAIYFDCVNANGGIYGHPIEYSYEDAAPDPAVLESLAIKLVEEDGVVGIVGNTELLECDVNGDYYESKGFHPIIAGVAPGCFLSDQWSAVNMGPYYSNLGGAQAALRFGAVNKLVIVSPDQPGMDFNNSSVADLAYKNGLEFESFLETVPFADPAGLAQKIVDAAGEGAGVVLNFPGPTVTPLLQAIEEQGLVDSVIWASSTPPNDDTVAAAVGDAWNGKFLINAEFNVLDSGLPDQTHANEIHAAANADFPMAAFAQMGYLVGRFTTEALLSLGEGAEYTVESVNGAIYGLKGVESDMLCKPWYYTSGTGANVSNNADRTVAPDGDKMSMVEDCFDIEAIDADESKGILGNPLGAIREAEAAA